MNKGDGTQVLNEEQDHLIIEMIDDIVVRLDNTKSRIKSKITNKFRSKRN